MPRIGPKPPAPIRQSKPRMKRSTDIDKGTRDRYDKIFREYQHSSETDERMRNVNENKRNHFLDHGVNDTSWLDNKVPQKWGLDETEDEKRERERRERQEARERELADIERNMERLKQENKDSRDPRYDTSLG